MSAVHHRLDRTLVIGETVIDLWNGICTRTTLPGGDVVMAAAQDNDDYRQRAWNLGYGTDTARMSAEHEIAHALLADLLGLPESPALRAAHDGTPPAALTDHEEHAVLAFQLFCRTAGVDLADVAARYAARGGR